MPCRGPNGEDRENSAMVSNTEPMLFNSHYPYCLLDFTEGQEVAKYRRGRAVCANFYDSTSHQG